MDVRCLGVFAKSVPFPSLYSGNLFKAGNESKIRFHFNEVVSFNTLFSL